jgi:hypothetical protein
MSSLTGKLTTMATAAALRNDTSLSLANLNVDFTLKKYEAPKEFYGLGETISIERKADAENGRLHRTARKLGALFEGLLPSTPYLLRAYGKRVSEISQQPGINPRGSDLHGIFANQIGADSTSIWAAATSGADALAVHLLACMLARMFSGPEATAVWVELVDEQKQKIYHNHAEALYTEKLWSSMLAAQQEFSREELGNWDASARAWLQSADEAKARQHTQLMLILNNTNFSIKTQPDLYESVVGAWKSALLAMDNLLQGLPQQVQEGAALLGISSWHMYPDMTVLGDTLVDISQRDPIFSGTAILTLGLEIVRKSQKGVSWSLPLARLRFYGQPVETQGVVSSDNSRHTMKEFGYIVLGCVFSQWQDFGKTPEAGATWLHDIMELIQPTLGHSVSLDKFRLHWLKYLDSTAQSLLDSTDMDLKLANQLVALGRRKSDFIYQSNWDVKPLFGLSNIRTLIPMMVSSHMRIEFLRKLALDLKFDDEKYLIRYRPLDSGNSKSTNDSVLFEFATVIPPSDVKKRTNDGRRKPGSGQSTAHVRWISFNEDQLAGCGCGAVEENLLCSCGPELWALKCTNSACADPDTCELLQHTQFWRRQKSIKQLKECCLAVLDVGYADGSSSQEHGEHLRFGHGTTFEDTFQSLKRTGTKAPRPNKTVHLKFVVGDPSTAAIFVTADCEIHRQTSELSPRQLRGLLVPEIVNPVAVSTYLLKELSFKPESLPLVACAAVADIYKLIPDATISTRVLSLPLSKAHWVLQGLSQGSTSLSRPQAFACIAMFDSGTCNLDPLALQEVFAMASGNSIFIYGALLCDPYEDVKPSEIRRVIGNIGRAGVSLLMGPPNPEIREPELQNWKQINHAAFQGVPDNCFQETSVHLSFTGYDMPLVTQQNERIIDRSARLVETLASVHDRGKWVGDLDLIKSPKLPNSRFNYTVHRLLCEGHKSALRYNKCQRQPKLKFAEVLDISDRLNAISIDNWDELLEAPKSGTFFIRAHKNWLSRFALAHVCSQLGFRTIILPEEVCWSCCAYALSDRTDVHERIALIY